LYKPNITILEKCINSLISQLNNLIIVDNTPGKCEFIEQFKSLPNIEIIVLNDNYGIAYAQNIGIKKALEENAEYILFSDQDTIYPPDFVEKMLECFKENKVAAAGPLFVDAHTGKIQFFIKKGILGFKKINPKAGKHEILQLIASGTIINAKFISEIGLMKEDLFIDWVDMEWCWRAIKSGYKIIGNADVIIEHRLGESPKNIGIKVLPQRSPLRHYYITRNAVHLALKCNSLNLPQRITLFLKSLKYIIGFSLFISPRFKNLKYTLKGFYHGLIGKLGKFNEEL